MTKKDREILRKAGIIIRNEMKEHRDVNIPDLGKFTTGTTTYSETPPWIDGDKQKFIKVVPRFRAYRELKAIVAQVKAVN